MPRNRIDDPDTPGLYLQVNCRAAEDLTDDPDEVGGGDPGHLQISTHDDRPDARVRELFVAGRTIMAAMASAIKSGEPMSPDLEWVHAEWYWKLDNFRAELTGTYVTLTRITSRDIIRQLHRGMRLAWPPRELVSGALSDVPTSPTIPRAGEVARDYQQLPVPGASGYPLPPTLE